MSLTLNKDDVLCSKTTRVWPVIVIMGFVVGLAPLRVKMAWFSRGSYCKPASGQVLNMPIHSPEVDVE